MRLTRASSSGVMGLFWRSEGEEKRVIATSPSPERETFHFCWGVAVSVWRAGSGSMGSLGGVEGVGGVVMLLGDGLGLRFQMAILIDGVLLGGLGRVNKRIE